MPVFRSSKKERRQVLGRESVLLTSLGLFRFAALLSLPDPPEGVSIVTITPPQSSTIRLLDNQRPSLPTTKKIKCPAVFCGSKSHFPTNSKQVIRCPTLSCFPSYRHQRSTPQPMGRCEVDHGEFLSIKGSLIRRYQGSLYSHSTLVQSPQLFRDVFKPQGMVRGSS